MSPSAVDEDRVLYTHVSIVYTDGFSEFFDAIQVTDKGVIIGRCIENEQGEQEFLGCGFIAHSMIQKITHKTTKKKQL